MTLQAQEPIRATQQSDPAHDILRSEPHPFESFFDPKTIAVIGATDRPGHLGRKVIQNLLSNSAGAQVFPVSATRSSVLGVKAYPTVSEVPVRVDLAVIITPASTVPAIISDCVGCGVRSAIIISSGFREHGIVGQALEQDIKQRIAGSGLRIVGPNCIGIMNPTNGLNATFASKMALPGNVAFISQSGALCTSILDWSLREMVGFSSVVSVGSMMDVGWGDLIDYFGNDERTQSIVIYMESIGDARGFLSAAREVSLTKPIIVIKTGRTEAAAKAAASHTGTLTGSDEVLDAAFRRAGVLRVDSVSDLFYMAEVLAKQPRPKGNRLAIVTNAGGPGVLAADALMAGGGDLSKLSPATSNRIDALLPPHWSHSNPIDVLGDATAERFEEVLVLALNDENFDGVLAITAPQGLADPTEIADRVTRHTGGPKPLLASFMGGEEIATSEAILHVGGIPTFPFPDAAARAFNYMWQYTDNLRALYETPHVAESEDPDRIKAEQLLRSARESGRRVLNEWESKQVLGYYGIPVVETRRAHSAEAAAEAAKAIGYPVVLKLLSNTITHKSDIGGVKLDLSTEEAVKAAYEAIRIGVEAKAAPDDFLGVTVQPMIEHDGFELILGSSIDAQFGPVLLFGAGGELVEIFKDRALALPPLNSTLARRMMEQTRIWKALHGVRGHKPADISKLEALVVRFSQLVMEQPWIAEIDINPLVIAPDQLLALDARIIVHPPSVSKAMLPQTAIRAYPERYVSDHVMKNGESLKIRPILPEDEPAMVHFHERLSERSVFLRYFEPLKMSARTAHERLTRICFIDYDREMVLVAERKDAETGESEIVAVARLTSSHTPGEAECAVLVSDEYQNLGLGTQLLREVLFVASHEQVRIVRSWILKENSEMLFVARKLGFKLDATVDELRVRAAYTVP